MGLYIQLVDIERRFGTDNIVTWSNVNNDSSTTADLDTVNEAIDEAEGDVNDHFRGSKYVVPFSGTIPKQVKRWALIKAGIILYENRGVRDTDVSNRLDVLGQDVENEIRQYLSYQRTFDRSVAVTETQPDAPVGS